MTFTAVLENIVGSLVAAAIIGGILALTVAWHLRRRRRPLQQFFGISPNVPNVAILTGHLHVQPRGAEQRIGDPKVTTGFTGAAMARSEYLAAITLRDLLTSSPWILRFGSLTDLLLDRVDRVRPTVTIDVADRKIAGPHEIPKDNLILLGSRVYNSLTYHYFDHADAENAEDQLVTFDRVDGDETTRRTICVKGDEKETSAERAAPPGHDGASPHDTGQELAVIQRLREPVEPARTGDRESPMRTVIAVYGYGAAATSAAALIVANEWSKLAELPDRFAMVLRFDDFPRDIAPEQDLRYLRQHQPEIVAIVTEHVHGRDTRVATMNSHDLEGAIKHARSLHDRAAGKAQGRAPVARATR